jgi:hypothetical protein
MRVRTLRQIGGDVTTTAPLRLELRGHWRTRVRALIDGADATVARLGQGVIAIDVPAGHHALLID